MNSTSITYKQFKELTKTYKIVNSIRIETVLSYYKIKSKDIKIQVNYVNRGIYIDLAKRCYIHFYLLENSQFYKIYYFRPIKNQPRWIMSHSLNKWLSDSLKKEKLNILLNNIK